MVEVLGKGDERMNPQERMEAKVEIYGTAILFIIAVVVGVWYYTTY